MWSVIETLLPIIFRKENGHVCRAAAVSPDFFAMMEIFTAQTLEDAKQLAADAFCAPVEDIQFTILEEPKRAILGIFGKATGEYKVRAEYDPVAAVKKQPAETVQSAAEVVTPAVGEVAAKVTEEPAAAEVAPAVAAEDADKPLPADADDRLVVARDYLSKILASLSLNVTVDGAVTEHGVEISLDGSDAGALIGHRGDTLDALQYLTSMVANRGGKDYVRVSLNACNYRDKRRKALQELAVRLSKNAISAGRPVALEPMNPYERRIIHSTVSNIDGVSSSSSGEEPNRRVIIMPDSAVGKNEKPIDMRRRESDRRRGGRNDRGDRGNRGGRGGRRGGERKPTGEVRRLDLSTSFEKDYKRPKPEDALNTGVYGKIDLD